MEENAIAAVFVPVPAPCRRSQRSTPGPDHPESDEVTELETGARRSRKMHVCAPALFIGLLAAMAGAGGAYAEQAPPTSSRPCPQDDSKGPAPPARGTPAPDNPSDRLADSKGVVCPPTGVDPDIRVPPPSREGTIKVIPAPGTPGGDPKTQPK